jgi:uncharacterized protein YwqG
MSLFGRLLRSKPKTPMRDVAALAAPHAVPAVHVSLDNARSRSHFGGRPNLPEGTDWPTRNGFRLDFLARLSLAEIQRAGPLDWLPSTGALLFFYDLDRQPWGYDPADRGSWAVLLVGDLEAPATAADALPTSGPRIPFRFAHFHPIQSLPSSERESIESLDLSDAESEELMRLTDQVFGTKPKHQVGGFPSPVQGDDMELEAQLVSHGLYCGNESGFKDSRVPALRAGAPDWRLLLQFDSDEDLGVMWGDAGTLYFWVPEAHAREGNFQTTWLVLQCC